MTRPPVARTMHRWFGVLAWSLLAATGTTAVSQAQSLSGVVADEANGNPVSGVSVILLDEADKTVTRAQTGPDGRYTISAPKAGTYRLRFEVPGYRMVVTTRMALKSGQTQDFPMKLHAIPATAMDTIVIEGKAIPRHLYDFYLRKTEGLGTFLTPDDIERWHPSEPTDLVRHLEGFKVVWDTFDPQRRMIVNQRQGFSTSGRACTPLIYLDGAYVGNSESWDIDAFLFVNQIEAIESYPSAARVPISLNATGAKCGVIAIWTKK